MGLQMLCDGKRAFVNCTREVLLKDYATLFPSTHTVVEVLESVPPDELVKAALQRLKQAGYMIALDDFLVDDPVANWLILRHPESGPANDDRRGPGHSDQALWPLALLHAGRES
jgi:c-di-GMP-related signal transduction protein